MFVTRLSYDISSAVLVLIPCNNNRKVFILFHTFLNRLYMWNSGYGKVTKWRIACFTSNRETTKIIVKFKRIVSGAKHKQIPTRYIWVDLFSSHRLLYQCNVNKIIQPISIHHIIQNNIHIVLLPIRHMSAYIHACNNKHK